MSTALAPLSHHDILALVEPFTHGGRQIDLPACDRLARRLHFKPQSIDLADASGATAAALQDDLQLDCAAPDQLLLQRRLTHPGGLVATLQVQGPHAGPLLSWVSRVEPQQVFWADAGWVLAGSYRLEPSAAALNALADGPAGAAAVAPQPLPAMRLVRADIRLNGLTLSLKMPAVKGYSAEFELTADQPIDLPEELLAVLGQGWSCLSRHSKGWRGTLPVRGKEPAASRQVVALLQVAARHLAQTLAQPPRQFHQQFALARWRVAARRALPLLSLVGLVLGALAVPYLGIEQGSVYWMLIFNAPPLLLVLGVSLREMPSFELPRPPRRLSAASWWLAPPPDSPLP